MGNVFCSLRSERKPLLCRGVKSIVEKGLTASLLNRPQAPKTTAAVPYSMKRGQPKEPGVLFILFTIVDRSFIGLAVLFDERLCRNHLCSR